MKRPWMAMYWADHFAKTGHLSTEEDGAYLRLIGHYWMRRKALPNDSRELARMAGLTLHKWKKVEKKIAIFFRTSPENWTHPRVEEELAKALKISNVRRDAVNNRYAKEPTIVDDLKPFCTPQSQTQLQEEKKDAADAARGTAEKESGLSSRAQTFGTRKNGSAVRETSAAEARNALERDLYARGTAVLGQNSRGLVAKLHKAKGLEMARAAIERAATKYSPRDYIGRIVANEGVIGPESEGAGRI